MPETLLEARKAAAHSCADHCRKMLKIISKEPTSDDQLSEPMKANLERAFRDLEQQMRDRAL